MSQFINVFIFLINNKNVECNALVQMFIFEIV